MVPLPRANDARDNWAGTLEEHQHGDLAKLDILFYGAVVFRI